VIARKAVDSFDEAEEFVVGEAEAIAIGDTNIRMTGDLTVLRGAPDAGDEIVADYILVDVDDSEKVTFLENGVQVTAARFFSVKSIESEIIVDRVLASASGELLGVDSLAQPAPGTQYLASYTFAAPLDGETITVAYNYNDAIRTVANSVEADRVLTSDTLVRDGFEVQTRVEANVRIASGFNANAILIDVSNALGVFFATRPTFGGTILVTQIESTIEDVTGVTSATITVLSRTPQAVVNDFTLTDREYATLAPNNPILTISPETDTSAVLATNSI
jgi:hypothetical protein